MSEHVLDRSKRLLTIPPRFNCSCGTAHSDEEYDQIRYAEEMLAWSKRSLDTPYVVGPEIPPEDATGYGSVDLEKILELQKILREHSVEPTYVAVFDEAGLRQLERWSEEYRRNRWHRRLWRWVRRQACR